MNVVIHHCGWMVPHVAHVSPVVHHGTPSVVTFLSCPGTDSVDIVTVRFPK